MLLAAMPAALVCPIPPFPTAPAASAPATTAESAADPQAGKVQAALSGAITADLVFQLASVSETPLCHVGNDLEPLAPFRASLHQQSGGRFRDAPALP
jgi:hypothetical protein